MYAVKKAYVETIQLMLRDIARERMGETDGTVELFPEVVVELSSAAPDKYEPLSGEIYGDMIFGYGVKWLAYLLQEGELIYRGVNRPTGVYALTPPIVDPEAMKKLKQHGAFEIEAFGREDAGNFIVRMRQQYPGMPLPIPNGNRDILANAIYDLVVQHQCIGISGGIIIEE